MKKIVVNIKKTDENAYPIFIGSNILAHLERLHNLKKYSKIVIITDRQVERLFLKNAPQFWPNNTSIISIPAGERAKNIRCVEGLWEELTELGCDRKSLIINIGGGVVCDIGGFVASTYMRGISTINIPTTLLSQVDASVGGKTGINFSDVKNIIGTFHQPKAVIIDVKTLATLPKRELLSGFAEIIKHALIKDKKYLTFVFSKKPQEFTEDDYMILVEKSCEIKSSIIVDDINEKGLRKIANFGHTIGHAIEILSQKTDNPLLHGEAISIGMHAELLLSYYKNLITQEELEYIVNGIEQSGLPIRLSEKIAVADIMEKIALDKKNEKGVINFTLLQGIGKAVFNQVVEEQYIRKAVKEISYGHI